MPALHARNRVGLNGKGEILMNSGVVPPDSVGVRVRRLVGLDALLLAKFPRGSVVADRCEPGSE